MLMRGGLFSVFGHPVDIRDKYNNRYFYSLLETALMLDKNIKFIEASRINSWIKLAKLAKIAAAIRRFMFFECLLF